MLYIHIPYCKGKCIYCNFYSGGNPDWSKYTEAVVSELKSRISELSGASLDSVYIGGGTPSLMPPLLFRDLICRIQEILSSEGILPNDALEFTIEVNPEDVNPESCRLWSEAGVNRVSMGIQSLSDHELKLLRRRHDSRRALEALDCLQSFFDNISVDFIYGIPGQTEESLESALNSVIGKVKHVSVYALTYEGQTPLQVLSQSGQIPKLAEESYLELERKVCKVLADAGFERYEISNFALPGYRSRHNSGYWDLKPYLGLGPSASSFDGKCIRRNNPPDLRRYMAHFSGENIMRSEPFYVEERLDKEQRIIEFIFTSLRRKEGIDLTKFRSFFGEGELSNLKEKAETFIQDVSLVFKDDRLELTEKGIPVSDFIIGALI